MPEPYPWRQFLTEPLHLWEFLALTLFVACLIGAGHVIKRHWTTRNEEVPLTAALLLWLGMFLLYLSQVIVFYAVTPPDHKLSVLAWCFVFWTAPVLYYGWTLVTSLSTATFERISPYNAPIEDPSEFSAARKLALRGDIDGAVARYRKYPENEPSALFEAARLLRSHDRCREAAAVLEEVAAHWKSEQRVWSEAIYQLARLYELHLNDTARARALYEELLTRTPISRHGQLAAEEYGRLEARPATPAEPEASSTAQLEPRHDEQGSAPLTFADTDDSEYLTEQPAPPRDPFYRPPATGGPAVDLSKEGGPAAGIEIGVRPLDPDAKKAPVRNEAGAKNKAPSKKKAPGNGASAAKKRGMRRKPKS